MKHPGRPADPQDSAHAELLALRARVAELERAESERALVSEALSESEARFRTLVANVPGTVYRSAIEHPFHDSFLSEGVLALTGYPAAEFMRPDGQSFGDLTLPEDQDHVSREVQAAVADSGTFSVRYRLRHRDGTIRWVHDQGRVTRAANGQPLCLDGVVVEITERAMAEEALRESESRYRTLVANLPGAVYHSAHTPPYRDLFVSEGVFAITGYTAAECLQPDGPTFGDLTLEEDRARVDEEIRQALRDRDTFEQRYRIRHRDGSIRWVHDQGRVTRADDGTPLHLDGVIRDVTEETRAGEALRESEARYRTIVGSVPGAVFLCRPEHPWENLFMSDGVLALTGYPASAFTLPSGALFMSITLPEDVPRITEDTHDAIARGRPWALQYRIRHLDGSIRWVYEGGQAAYDAEGRAVFLGGVIIDISERVRAEEALRESQKRLLAAQRIAHIGSWELDLDTNNGNWSEETYRIYRQDPLRFTPTFQSMSEQIHPDDRVEVLSDFAAAVRTGSNWDIAHRLLTPGGAVVHVHVQAELERDAAGRAVRAAGTIQDVTEQHRAGEVKTALEAQLRQAQKMEAIGTLAGGIAHDFNNILAAVIGHAEMLAQDLPSDDPGQDGVSGILVACQRARDLVQQILTFSRLRERERRLISLEPVILETLKLLRPSLPATIEIRSVMRAEGRQVLADPSQLHQILLNLYTNAAHAMRERGGTLEVRFEDLVVDDTLTRRHPSLHPGAHYARLTVPDTGHGMSPEVVQRIFDPFFTTKRPGEGTGLGLAVVHGIMQSHDGLITVASEPGRGTSFDLYFPTVDAQLLPSASEEDAVPHGHNEHILVVDDEEVLARIAGRILARIGYRVTTYSRPAEALADFLERPGEFDLVFSDLTMPGMTGLELATRILARRPEIPILLTSGYSGGIDTAEFERLGIRELVGKPFGSRAIAEAVHRALHPPAAV